MKCIKFIIVYIQPLTELKAKASIQTITAFTTKSLKQMIFKKISKNLLDHWINILIQNDKVINRLNQNKDFFLIADNDCNSSITDTLPMTKISLIFIYPQFSVSRDESRSIK